MWHVKLLFHYMNTHEGLCNHAEGEGMEDVLDRKKSVLIGRAILSYSALILFLLLPTMALKKFFALGIARLPIWKEFEFFTSMYKVIKEKDTPRHSELANSDQM